MNLQQKQLITIFFINGMAMTSASRVVVVEEKEDRIIYKESSRKRKAYSIGKDKINILFDGHDIPIKSDMDGNVYRGNACLNLVSEMSNEDLQKYIEEKSLNTVSDETKSRILHYTPDQANDPGYEEDKSNVLYPDFDFNHAVIDRAMKRS